MCYKCAIKTKRYFSPMQEKSRNISPIKERILQYLNYKGVSEHKFYKDTSIGKGLLKKKSEIGQSTLQKIFTYYEDLSPMWVLENKGPMLRNSGEQDNPQISNDDPVNIIVLKKLLEECRLESKSKEKTIRNLYEEIGMLRNEISRLSSEKCGIQIAAEPYTPIEKHTSLSPQKRHKKDSGKE